MANKKERCQSANQVSSFYVPDPKVSRLSYSSKCLLGTPLLDTEPTPNEEEKSFPHHYTSAEVPGAADILPAHRFHPLTHCRIFLLFPAVELPS